MKLGLVTYNLARDWDIPTIIQNCTDTGFEGVELRTTHAHGVEVGLSKQKRALVRKQFDDSPVEIAGLGSAFEYDAADPDEVRKNIEGTKKYIKLAADVGAPGVKVRPNGVQEDKGIPIQQTLEQIGTALREVGAFAADHGVETRLEVHGAVTSHPRHIRTIIDVADHPNVKVCWNSNLSDRLPDGTIGKHFDLLKHAIGLVHITDLANPEYPWREEFSLLTQIGYSGFCLAEVAQSADPIRFMKYYRALWLEQCTPKIDTRARRR